MNLEVWFDRSFSVFVTGYHRLQDLYDHRSLASMQQPVYRNTESSGVTGRGGGSVPPILLMGTFCWRIGKKEARKKRKRGENWKEKKENCKMEGEQLEMEEGKVIKSVEDFFSPFHFWKRRKIVLGHPKWEFSTGNKHYTPGKKSGKMTFCPLWKICLLRPWQSPQDWAS